MWEQRLERLPQVVLHAGAIRIAVADDPIARLLGLAWMDPPPAGVLRPPRPGAPSVPGVNAIRALLIPRCRSVHTFGMRFPLDLIWLDRDGRLLDVQANVARRRLCRYPGAGAVIETPAGRGAAIFGALARTGLLL